MQEGEEEDPEADDDSCQGEELEDDDEKAELQEGGDEKEEDCGESDENGEDEDAEESEGQESEEQEDEDEKKAPHDLVEVVKECKEKAGAIKNSFLLEIKHVLFSVLFWGTKNRKNDQ